MCLGCACGVLPTMGMQACFRRKETTWMHTCMCMCMRVCLQAYVRSMGHPEHKFCRSYPDLGLTMLPTMTPIWPSRPPMQLTYPAPLFTLMQERSWFMLCNCGEEECHQAVAKCAHVIRQMVGCHYLDWHAPISCLVPSHARYCQCAYVIRQMVSSLTACTCHSDSACTHM